MDSVGQRRMAELHGGRRDKLVVGPNLWAGVGLVRGGAGTALVGTPEQVAERIREYQAVGIDTIIGSGYPHLEEAYRVAELLFPRARARRERGARSATEIANEFTVGHPWRAPPAGRLVSSGLRQASAATASAGLLPVADRRRLGAGCRATGVIAANVLPAPLGGGRGVLAAAAVGRTRPQHRRQRRRARLPASPSAARSASRSASPTACRAERATLTDTTLQMIRNIPHLALIPLVILWFGIDEEAKLFLVALGVFFPIYVNTLLGIQSVDPQLVEMGRVYGMSRCAAVPSA